MLVTQLLFEAGGEGAMSGFVDAECLGHGRSDQVRIAHRGKRDKIYSITKIVEQAGSGLDGQARLADTRRADEREQSVGVAQQAISYSGYILIAPDQWGRRQGQVREEAGPGTPRGELGGLGEG